MKLDGTILYCGDHSKSDLVHFWCIFSEPKTRKTPSECTQKGFLFKNSAERARFELAIPFWGTHAFQACLFSHSSISPIRIRGLSVKTGLQR